MPPTTRPGERLVRVGGVLFGVGLLGVLATVVPFLFGRDDAPLGLTLVAAVLPVGFALALLGLLAGIRASRRG